MDFDTFTNAGAPRDNCNALDPINEQDQSQL